MAAVFSLSGCQTLQDPEASQEQSQETIATLIDGDVFKQSLLSRRQNFNTLQLWLRVPEGTATEGSTLKVHISPADQPDVLVGGGVYTLGDIQRSGTLQIPIHDIDDSSNKAYELELEPSGGTLQILGRTGDVYPTGEASLNGEVLPIDAAFRLTYEYDANSVWEDTNTLLSLSWLVFPLGVLLWLPGWLLIDWSGIKTQFHAIERFALAIGVSLAAIPVIMTWTSALNLQWTQEILLLTAAGMIILAVTNYWVKSRRQDVSSRYEDRLQISQENDPQRWMDVMMINALVGIFLLSLLVRIAMVRDLTAPPWVDAVHHGTLTHLIQLQGAYPESFTPYLALEAGSYHLGFHAVLAFTLWLAGLEMPAGMLIFGQVLNALAVIAVYLLTSTFTKNRWAGVVAALITGLITPMPAYYTSWGRYTQLAGLLILPAALAVFVELLERLQATGESAPKSGWRGALGTLWQDNWKVITLLSLLLAGMFITHMRVAAFTLSLAGIYYCYRLLVSFPRGISKQQVITEIAGLLMLALVSLILMLPWLPATVTNLLLPKLSAWSGLTTTPFSDFSWNYLTTALGRLSLVLAGLGFVWGVLRRKAFPITLAVWVASLFAMANLNAVGLPGGSFINNTSVTITLFMPIALLGGYFTADLLGMLKRHLPGYWSSLPISLIVIALTVAAAFGYRSLVPLLNPVTFLYRASDRPAIEWVDANLPAGAEILINPFPWGYGIYAGNDGAFWLSVLTENPSIPPPVLYGISNDQTEVARINQLSQAVLTNGANPEKIANLMQGNDIVYLLIGVRGGVLPPAAYMNSDLFKLLYQEEGAFVFKRR